MRSFALVFSFVDCGVWFGLPTVSICVHAKQQRKVRQKPVHGVQITAGCIPSRHLLCLSHLRVFVSLMSLQFLCTREATAEGAPETFSWRPDFRWMHPLPTPAVSEPAPRVCVTNVITISVFTRSNSGRGTRNLFMASRFPLDASPPDTCCV
jgi:hypothetical protein